MTRARDNAFNPFNNNYAGKNFVINGGFDIWQRGTNFVSPNAVYTSDRWSNDTGGMTISQESTGAPSGSRYYLRTTSTAGSAYTDYYHFFETNNISALWGKTVTYSFKIRKSGTSPIGSFILTLQKSSTVDAGRAATWSTITTVSTAFSSIVTGIGSTNWTTITATAIIPNDGTANSLRLIGGFDNGQSSGLIVDLAQVQLEIGSVATPFTRAGGTIGGELSLCQRYYEKNYIDSVVPGSNINPASSGMIEQQALFLTTASGATPGTARSRSFPYQFKVQKRTSPSVRVWDLAGNINRYTSGDSNGSFSSNNNQFDVFGGTQATQNSITWQTTMASSGHIYAGIMWEASAEL
jgi:hypothetical protein